MLEIGRIPPPLAYLYLITTAGVTFTLADYRTMAAINRDDLVLWNEAKIQREKDEAEMAQQNSQQPARSNAFFGRLR